MKNTKTLTVLAILMAIQIVITMFYIPVAENLRIYFSFLVAMTVAIVAKPTYALIYAVIEDILAFFVYPTGNFFLGYTLTAVVGMMIYVLFLNRKVTYTRIILSKILVNVIANICLNSLWSAVLFSKGYVYYLAKSVIKNIAMLPFDILIFIAVYKLISPTLLKHNLIDDSKILKPVSCFNFLHKGTNCL